MNVIERLKTEARRLIANNQSNKLTAAMRAALKETKMKTRDSKVDSEFVRDLQLAGEMDRARDRAEPINARMRDALAMSGHDAPRTMRAPTREQPSSRRGVPQDITREEALRMRRK
jgi:hypothetical protein